MNPETSSPAELVALLQGDAEIQIKARACQQLAITGTAAAVPALQGLLGHEKLGDYARCALENIPGTEAATALRNALPALKGKELAGAVNSLGVLRDKNAVPALIKLADDKSSGALAALGLIADEAALTEIRRLLSGPDAAAAVAGLAAARVLHQDSKSDGAKSLLAEIAAAKVPDHLVQAAKEQLWQMSAISLFDGASLAGWQGDPTWFRVYDRAIIAGTMDKPIPRNEFLVYEKEFSDFELRAQILLKGGKGNGGIQFRSQRVPGSHEMIGYQADIGPEYWGGIYDESRRKSFLGTRCKPEEIAAVIRPDGWNDYRIRCEGPRVQLWINGLLTTDFTETHDQIPRTGRIGVQIHSGKPAEVWYRDLRLNA
jgi:Domain of Unknown Function (DUF1080)